jgi:hypothetical protein
MKEVTIHAGYNSNRLSAMLSDDGPIFLQPFIANLAGFASLRIPKEAGGPSPSKSTLLKPSNPFAATMPKSTMKGAC